MNQTLFSSFDTSFEHAEHALPALRGGRGVVVLDDEDRESEGNTISPAETVIAEQMALTTHHGSGIACLCITEDRRKQFDLSMMVEGNISAYGTDFTVTIEAAGGMTAGVSTADCIIMVRAAAKNDAKPFDLNRPGCVSPLRAQASGVSTRGDHTETVISLMMLAGFKSAGMLCELTNDDGAMACAPECTELVGRHNMAIVTIENLMAYRQTHERKAG